MFDMCKEYFTPQVIISPNFRDAELMNLGFQQGLFKASNKRVLKSCGEITLLLQQGK